jgi:NTP pyrophosphatase (non-canonical NTP hydrolase)
METLTLIEVATTYLMCAILFATLGYVAGINFKCDTKKKNIDQTRFDLYGPDGFKISNNLFEGPLNINNSDSSPLTAGCYLGIRDLVRTCYLASVNAGWHHDLKTGQPLTRNKSEMICLMHSELSEAMEGIRKNLMDDKLPHRKMAEVELADCIIRICDFAGMEDYDLAGAISEKLRYNANRADHKPENRLKAGGKQF